jgi:hypothetical protein
VAGGKCYKNKSKETWREMQLLEMIGRRRLNCPDKIIVDEHSSDHRSWKDWS